MDIPLFIKSKKNCKGEGTVIFVRNLLGFNQRNDLSTNCEATESLSTEIFNQEIKNKIMSLIYKLSDGDFAACENYLKISFEKYTTDKHLVLVGDINLNLLDFKKNGKVQNFAYLMFQYRMIRTIDNN